MIIIGVTGSKGAGKTTVIEKLVTYFPASQTVALLSAEHYIPTEEDISDKIIVLEINLDSCEKLRTKVDVLIYVDTPPDICLARLAQRITVESLAFLANYETIGKLLNTQYVPIVKPIADITLDNSSRGFNMNLNEVLDFIYKSKDLKPLHRIATNIAVPTFDAAKRLVKKGTLYIVSGPSGVGKTSVIKKVIEKMPEIERLVPYSTREKRANESEGEPYHFITKTDYEALREKTVFLQHFEDYNQYYGIPLDVVLNKLNHGISLIIDVSSSVLPQVREKVPDLQAIYICPPKMASIMDRLGSRNEDVKSMQERYQKSERELEQASYNDYDYLIINDNLEKASEALRSIIDSVNFTLKKQQIKNAELLLNFKVYRVLKKLAVKDTTFKIDVDNISIEGLSSLNNRTFKVKDHLYEQSYFVRIAGDAEDIYRITGDKELLSLKQANDLNLYPKIIDYDLETYTYIAPYLNDYRKFTYDEVHQSDIFIKSVVSALKTLHQSPLFECDYVPIKYDERVLFALRQRQALLPVDMDKIAVVCHRVAEILDQCCENKAPCNNDISIYNLLYRTSDQHVVISDWECSGNNDVFWDLAKLSVEANFNDKQEDRLLIYYFGATNSINSSRLILQKLLVEFHLAVWAKLQAINNHYSISSSEFEKMHSVRMDNCRKHIDSLSFTKHLDNVTKLAMTKKPYPFLMLPPPESKHKFISVHRSPIVFSPLRFFNQEPQLHLKNPGPLQMSEDQSITLAILKPDIQAQNRIGEVISFLEKQGFKVIGLKMWRFNTQDVDKLYPNMKAERIEVLDLLTSGLCTVMVLQAEEAAKKLRSIKGATDPTKAEKNTLRNLFGHTIKWNAVHCSDDSASAQREINLFFDSDEISTMTTELGSHVHSL